MMTSIVCDIWIPGTDFGVNCSGWYWCGEYIKAPNKLSIFTHFSANVYNAHVLTVVVERVDEKWFLFARKDRSFLSVCPRVAVVVKSLWHPEQWLWLRRPDTLSAVSYSLFLFSSGTLTDKSVADLVLPSTDQSTDQWITISCLMLYRETKRRTVSEHDDYPWLKVHFRWRSAALAWKLTKTVQRQGHSIFWSAMKHGQLREQFIQNQLLNTFMWTNSTEGMDEWMDE